MNKYRLIEKKGTTKEIECEIAYTDPCHEKLYESICIVNGHKRINKTTCSVYIPLYIIQEYTLKDMWVNLKEFTDIYDARKYKRNLELEQGVVIG